MKKIPLTSGGYALVDDEDYEFLVQWSWRIWKPQNRHAVYVRRGYDSKAMHRIILGLDDPSIVVDHRNHDGLDNTRSNLRVCTTGENCRNRKVNPNTTSGYKGLYLNRATNKWVARIKHKKKCYRLGTFPTAEEAAEAYNVKAKELHGEFAYLNPV